MQNKMLITNRNTARKIIAFKPIYWLFIAVTVTIGQTVLGQNIPVVPGDGPYSAPQIAGDTGTPPAVASEPITTASTRFPQQPENTRLTIYLTTETYAHNTHQPKGVHTVLTIRPDNLNAMKRDLVAGVLNIDLGTVSAQSTETLTVPVTQQQLQQIQYILYPSVTDSPTGSKESWLFNYLPIIKPFSRYAVLVGVVLATILFSFAAYALTMGERGSGQRIISTATGLILLLMAFTIYRLLISNSISHLPAPNTAQLSQ